MSIVAETPRRAPHPRDRAPQAGETGPSSNARATGRHHLTNKETAQSRQIQGLGPNRNGRHAMEDTTGPSKDVLAERIAALSTRFGGVERRLDLLPTQQQLTDLVTGRDALYQNRFDSQAEDIRDLTALVATERSERIAAITKEAADREAADEKNEARVRNSRNLAIAAIGVAVSFLLGIVVLIQSIGGVTP